MNILKASVLVAVGLSMSACVSLIEGGERTGEERSFDGGRDNKHLSNLRAGIWVDPNGCDHWFIDDGVEGYSDARLTPDGRPVCSGIAPPNTATGPFREGTNIPDPL